MLQTEYIRNLNCNYERILLDQHPEEKRYQYCIVTRGGIRGLLPCSLRYINDQAYLYYDISSTQSVAQFFARKSIRRQWICDFLWWMKRIRQELRRFLLEDVNLLWYPEQIFQDLEKNDFFFVYVPYYQGENGLEQLFDFLAEHIDYEDDVLVEVVYKMHEQYRLLGGVYLEEKIYEDAAVLEQKREEGEAAQGAQEEREQAEMLVKETGAEERTAEMKASEERKRELTETEENHNEEERENRRGIRYFLDGRKKKQKDERELPQNSWGRTMPVYAVGEEGVYRERARMPVPEPQEQEEFGRTVYIEDIKEEVKREGLYDEAGKKVCSLEQQTIVLGKKREEADCVVEHGSVSRMHARITREKDEWYLEDLNSTNGTWKNGIRLQPYEKRRLEKEDEIRLGKVVLFYR